MGQFDSDQTFYDVATSYRGSELELLSIPRYLAQQIVSNIKFVITDTNEQDGLEVVAITQQLENLDENYLSSLTLNIEAEQAQWTRFIAADGKTEWRLDL